MILTEEQEACLTAAKSSDSLLLNALAGAAKTSTLCLMAQKLPLVPTFCGAFNKRIADEMGKRMPGHIQCSTMNSIGHRVWAQTTGKRLKVDTDKTYSALSAISGKMRPEERKRVIGDTFASVLRAVRLCKSAGYVPKSQRSFGESLCETHELIESFAQQLDLDPDEAFLDLVDKLLEHSIAEAFSGSIDFDDQIYMSTLFGGNYPKFPILMIDEAQDLSPLNHKTLERMFSERLIAVGDPHQAIYAFRGASHTSMSELKTRFNMRELTLSTSFRCPQRVVENAWWRVPHMRFPDWAVAGLVERLGEWNTNTIPDGAAVICRNNAPLFSVAMKLLKAGRGIKILGNDIGAGLVKILEKLGSSDMAQAQALAAIDAWEEAQLKKAHRARHANILDKASCLKVFVRGGETLAEGTAYAKMIFAASGPIQLMTGHKSKGGEWPIVFHLDSFLVPSKWAIRAAEAGDSSQMIQENNLKYVIETRAMESLYFINSEDFQCPTLTT